MDGHGGIVPTFQKSKIQNPKSKIINLFLFVSSLAENQGRPRRDRPYH
jgi:hypothetical protein